MESLENIPRSALLHCSSYLVRRPSTPTSKYSTWFSAAPRPWRSSTILVSIITLDPAVWTGKEAAPSSWQSLAASTQRHGTRSFSKTMPCELGVQNRSRGAYLTTRQTHCGCMARPSAAADTLACCSRSGSLGHALPVAEYTAVVQYSTMICSAEHTHTDMHTQTILLCAPTRAAELFAAERDKVRTRGTGVDKRRPSKGPPGLLWRYSIICRLYYSREVEG